MVARGKKRTSCMTKQKVSVRLFLFRKKRYERQGGLSGGGAVAIGQNVCLLERNVPTLRGD